MRRHRPHMSDTSLPTVEPSRQARAVQGRSQPLRVTGKLRKAIDFMVWEGSKADLQSAAAHAEMTTHSLRCALERPHVKAYYNQQIEVLRTSERARNIHRAVKIRDAAENMPAMHAIRYLDQIPDENASSRKALTPGFVVQIVNVVPGARDPQSRGDQAQVIDATASDGK